MKLCIVRHGQTEENVAGILTGQIDAPLTEKGIAQARETAESLKNHIFSHIYSSDLDSCKDNGFAESIPRSCYNYLRLTKTQGHSPIPFDTSITFDAEQEICRFSL